MVEATETAVKEEEGIFEVEGGGIGLQERGVGTRLDNELR